MAEKLPIRSPQKGDVYRNRCRPDWTYHVDADDGPARWLRAGKHELGVVSEQGLFDLIAGGYVDLVYPAPRQNLLTLLTLRPIAEWHEAVGPVLWWTLPIQEPPYCGTPLDTDWPGEHTHWTPVPIPNQQAA